MYLAYFLINKFQFVKLFCIKVKVSSLTVNSNLATDTSISNIIMLQMIFHRLVCEGKNVLRQFHYGFSTAESLGL